MSRSKRDFFDRSTGINVSVPLWLVNEIDKECKKKQIDRSTLVRKALAAMNYSFSDEYIIKQRLAAAAAAAAAENESNQKGGGSSNVNNESVSS